MFPPLPKVMISFGFNISSCSFPFGLSFLSFFQAALIFFVFVFWVCLFHLSELIDVLISSELSKQTTIMVFFCLRSFWNFVFKISFSDFFSWTKIYPKFHVRLAQGIFMEQRKGACPALSSTSSSLHACLICLEEKLFPAQLLRASLLLQK